MSKLVPINLLLAFLLLFSLQQLFAQGSPNVPLLATMNLHSGAGYNDCWGYTAPDGREYALLGAQNGTSIVDITDTDNLVEIAFIPSATSLWKDIKTYQHYAYVVTEASGGMQIIDLSNLPNSATVAATYNGFSTSHNIYIDEASGILLAEGGGAVRTISLADPLNPVQVSNFGIECHDIYLQNGIAYVSEGSSGSFGVYDLSNPASPSLISRINVPSAGYCHNAWVTADDNYMMTTEETPGKTIKYWDISDPTNAFITDEVLGANGFAHNAHIKGDFSYVSHYSDGLKIYDISDPLNVFEAGFYDTEPGGGISAGAWGAFPFFKSGKVIISDQAHGLFVVFFEGARELDPDDPEPPANVAAYSDYTTPSTINLTWDDPTKFGNGNPLPASDFTIEIHRDGVAIASVAGGTENYSDNGLNDRQLYDYGVFAKVIATDSTSAVKTLEWHAGGSPVPGSPQNLTCSATNTQAALAWDDPTAQADGTPLDDLAGINLYRNGTLIATVAPGTESYMDTPTPGFSYIYTLSAKDNETPSNESALSNEVNCFVGSAPNFMVWVGPDVGGKSADSGDSLFAALVANGESAFLSNNLFEFGNDLSIYDAVFVVLGIFSDNHVLANGSAEATALESYLQNGGNLYLEGGDAYNYDPDNAGGHNIRPWFGVGLGSDGDGDVNGINGLNGLSAFSFSYSGDNSWMDELAPTGSTPIWQNDSNADVSGVFHNGFGSGMSIGVVPSFGGLDDASAPLNRTIRIGPVVEQKNHVNKMKERGPRSPRKPFVKKAAHYPELKDSRKENQDLFTITPEGVEIFANTKVDLMAAYLGLFGHTGTPRISMNTGILDFDSVFVNQQNTQDLWIHNIGRVALDVTDIVSTNSAFSVNSTQFTVAERDSQLVEVYFTPSAIGAFSGELKIASTDPNSDTVRVQLSGMGIEVTGIENDLLPDAYAISPNYPNPFNPSTRIEYQLPEAGFVNLSIYNMLGQKIRTLVNTSKNAGYYHINWDGRNDHGATVGSGIYIYRFQAGKQFNSVHKMILMK